MTKHSLLRVLCGREISSSKSLLRWLSHQIPSKYVVLVTFGCCNKMSYKGNLKKKAFILAYSLVALGHSGRSLRLQSSLICSPDTGECGYLAHFLLCIQSRAPPMGWCPLPVVKPFWKCLQAHLALCFHGESLSPA